MKNSRVDEQTSFFVFVDRGFSLGVRSPVKHMKDGGIDELRVFNRQLTDIEVRYLHDPTDSASNATLEDYATARHPHVVEAAASLQASREALVKALDPVPEIMVMGDTLTPRQSYILKRGVFSEHGEPVEPTALESILPYDASAPRNRLGLAQWLFSKDHPLTARVFVNRLWQMHFGRGLVETAQARGSVEKILERRRHVPEARRAA